MQKVIKSPHEQFERLANGKELLKVIFEDNSGNQYIWTPKWADIRRLFLKSFFTESSNTKGESSEWEEFGKDIELLHLLLTDPFVQEKFVERYYATA